jgi:two-component system nitrate/nitrite response regulator NarL
MSLHSFVQDRRAFHAKGEPSATVYTVCTNPLLRIGLEKILAGSGFVVWHETIKNPANMPHVQEAEPVLFLIDGNRSSAEIMEIVKALKERSPDAKVIVLADHFEPNAITEAWHIGVHGFCLSNQNNDVLIKSLELVMLGEIVLPSTLVLSLAEQSVLQTQHGYRDQHDNAGHADLKDRKLSNREAEILICLKEGAPNKVIARRLNLSEATVKVHVKAILKKIGACNRTQAALWATRHGTANAESP